MCLFFRCNRYNRMQHYLKLTSWSYLCWCFIFHSAHGPFNVRRENLLNEFVRNAFKGITMEITYKSLFLHILFRRRDTQFTCSKVHHPRCWMKKEKGKNLTVSLNAENGNSNALNMHETNKNSVGVCAASVCGL